MYRHDPQYQKTQRAHLQKRQTHTAHTQVNVTHSDKPRTDPSPSDKCRTGKQHITAVAMQEKKLPRESTTPAQPAWSLHIFNREVS